MKWLMWLSAVAIIAAAFFPWVTVPSQNLVITGMDAQKYGSPSLLHFFFTGVVIFFSLFRGRWAQMGSVLAAALNAAWAFRNFLLLSACVMGECPVVHLPLYTLIIFSPIMLIAALFPGRKS